MNLLASALSAALLAAAILPAQIPVYSSNEDYCAKNPDAPTCKNGKPLDMHFVAPNTDEWCEKYPAALGCRDGHFVGTPNFPGAAPGTTPGTTKTRSVAPRATAPALYTPPVPSTPQANAPAGYRLPAPPTGRKGSPVDIRLGELDWRLLPSQSDLLIGINLGNLLESEVARTLLREWAGKLGATQEEQDKLLAGIGDVTQAVISVHQREMLAVLVGNLEDFSQSSQIGGLQVMRVSADTVLLGSPEALRWAMFRLKFGLAMTAALEEQQQLSQTYQFWAWAKPAALAALGQGVSSNSPLTKIKIGASLKDRFRMDMIMDAADAAAAKRVLESSRKTAPRDFQASVEGASVHYALILDRTATLARFGSFMTDSVGKQFAPLLAAARQISAAKASGTARPAPGKVVIDGLDDGPKEVPLAQKN
jgi:hypothetical protein